MQYYVSDEIGGVVIRKLVGKVPIFEILPSLVPNILYSMSKKFIISKSMPSHVITQEKEIVH